MLKYLLRDLWTFKGRLEQHLKEEERLKGMSWWQEDAYLKGYYKQTLVNAIDDLTELINTYSEVEPYE